MPQPLRTDAKDLSALRTLALAQAVSKCLPSGWQSKEVSRTDGDTRSEVGQGKD
jgi:hypothetical protein